MEPDLADIDLIEKYIHGKLTAAEVYHFENRLGDDREFARKYRLRKTFPEMMQETGGEAEKEETASSALKTEREHPNRKKPVYLALGAIAVIISGFLFFFIFTKTNHQGEKSTEMRSVPVNNPNSGSPEKQAEKDYEHKGIESPIKKPVELATPAEGMTFSRKEDILFTWKLETDTFTNLYVFSEIRDKLVLWKGIRPGIREHKMPAHNILPGRYYWYVGNKEMRRFFIIMNEHGDSLK
jgi:hypothetical protein